MAASCTAAVRRASNNALAYARTAPGVGNSILGSVPDGVGGYRVLESRLDDSGLAWLRLDFVGGSSGWVSSDRLDIQGDCSAVGYGIVAQPTIGLYSMTKHAVEAYTDALAGEMRRVGVRVSAIEPGNFRTELAHNVSCGAFATPSIYAHQRSRPGNETARAVERCAQDGAWDWWE